MATDVTRTGTAGRHLRAVPMPAPDPPPPQRAQLVWQRSLELTSPQARPDGFALALELLRAAHHDPDTMAHALTLGRTHLRSHPDDGAARDGARILETAIAFLGIKPRDGDVTKRARP